MSSNLNTRTSNDMSPDDIYSILFIDDNIKKLFDLEFYTLETLKKVYDLAIKNDDVHVANKIMVFILGKNENANK